MDGGVCGYGRVLTRHHEFVAPPLHKISDKGASKDSLRSKEIMIDVWLFQLYQYPKTEGES